MGARSPIQMALAVWICLVVAVAAQDSTSIQSNGVSDGYEVLLTHEEIKTDAIVITWNITDSSGVDIDSFVVRCIKEGGTQTITSVKLLSNTTRFEIEDLVPEAEYEVCLITEVADDSYCAGDNAARCEECLQIKTIPMMRDDSLIALVLTLFVLFFLILVGILCWHCAKKQKEKDDGDDTESNASDHSGKPILLSVPPTSNGPRRSVDFEDEDIPYITPPVSQNQSEKVPLASDEGGTMV